MTAAPCRDKSPLLVAQGRWALLLAGMRAQLIFLPLILAYWAAYRLLLLHLAGAGDLQFHKLLLKVFAIIVPLTLLAFLVYKFFRMVLVERPPDPLRQLVLGVWRFFSHPQRLAMGLPMLVLFIFFAAIFSDIKQNIPRFAGFSWDVTFAEWDKALHLGRHPWQWLQPVLGYPFVTFLVNFVYNLWFFVMWIFIVCMAFAQRPSELRTRFFLSFFLAWSVGGSLFALLLASAGPCYFGRLGLAPDPYAGLMAYLHAVSETYPVWALAVQDTLWRSYTDGGLVAGISAMPSMHNATALLLALAARRVGRGLGLLLWAHFWLIFIGSIHLAWHYAIDNYLGWAIALACWRLAAPLARWWEGQAHIRNLGEALETAVRRS